MSKAPTIIKILSNNDLDLTYHIPLHTHKLNFRISRTLILHALIRVRPVQNTKDDIIMTVLITVEPSIESRILPVRGR